MSVAHRTDITGMANWLQSIQQRVKPDRRGDVRQTLERLQRDGVRLKVSPVVRRAARKSQATATIEMIRESDFVISQPILHGQVLPLATHELVELNATCSEGRLEFVARALGRFKTSSGSGKPFFGYRIDLPNDIRVDERRRYHRVLVGYDLAPEGMLRTPDRALPIHGLVEDISAAGVRLKSKSSGDHLRRGQFGYLHMTLPHPVGDVNTLVRLCAVARSPLDETTTIHLAFDKPVPELDAFIRSVDKRRSARIRRH